MSEYPIRVLPDGHTLTVYPLTFGRGRLVIARPGTPKLPNGEPWSYDDGW